MKTDLPDLLRIAADFHKKTGRHENAALFAEAAAAIRELEARADIDQSAYEELLRAKEAAEAESVELQEIVELERADAQNWHETANMHKFYRNKAEALEAAAIGLVDFHNGPPETKRPDIYQRHMVRIAAALRAFADKGNG